MTHVHHPNRFDRVFAIGVALNAAFVVVEAVFGVLSGSLALLADAGHNLGDVVGLLLAWGASVLVRRTPTTRYTYGFRRTSVLASMVNAVVLLVAVGALGLEAIQRFGQPSPVASGTVMAVAAAGVVINGFTAWMLYAGRTHDLNIRGAYLHMAADAVISVGVVVSALAMGLTGWLWLDPAVTLVIAVAIGLSSWGLLQESWNLVLDAVPAKVRIAEVQAYLAGLPGVCAVHDLHVWAMSTSEVALTVHLVKPDGQIDDAWMSRVNAELRDRFHIHHTAIQCEQGDASHPCAQAPAEAV